MTLLADARKEMLRKVDKGTRCPVCGRFTKVYPYTHGSTRVLCLRALERLGGRERWVHVSEIAKVLRPYLKDKTSSATKNFCLLKHWGFITPMRKHVKERGSSGKWMLTKLGLQFLRGVPFPKHAYVYQNEVVRFSHETVTIKEAAGDHYHHDRFMARTAPRGLVA